MAVLTCCICAEPGKEGHALKEKFICQECLLATIKEGKFSMNLPGAAEVDETEVELLGLRLSVGEIQHECDKLAMKINQMVFINKIRTSKRLMPVKFTLVKPEE